MYIKAIIGLHKIDVIESSTISFNTTVVNVLNNKDSIKSLAQFVEKLNASLPKADRVQEFAYVQFVSDRVMEPCVEILLGENATLKDVIAECEKIEGFKKESLAKLHEDPFVLDRAFKTHLSYWLASTDSETMEIINQLHFDDEDEGVWLYSEKI